MSRLRSPRLLIYSQDGLGLGHQRRTTLLAAEFLAARPGATALTMSDSPLGQFFPISRGHDYLKLPSIVKAGPGKWHPVSMALPFGDVLHLRREIIRSTVLTYRPDVLLVDHMPHGAMGELVPTLETLRSLPVRVVLGLRDILDAPTTIRHRWRLEGAFEAVERHYDDVLVYGSQDVFDVATEYEWPRAASAQLRYCGYVCSPPPPAPLAKKVRERYRDRRRDGDLIVAMAGGGADANALFDTLVRAVPGLVAQRPCTVVIVTGPFLPAAERRALLRRAKGLPVKVLTSVSDSTVHLEAADLTIAMAGYNTTAEILSLGKRALLVPRAGPSAEQQMRARLFADRQWVHWLAPESLSAETMTRAVLEALAAPPLQPPVEPDLGGRTAAAHRLLAPLDSARSEWDEQAVVGAVPAMVASSAAEPALDHPAAAGQREPA
jgi:predicted glycosyltransferase